MAAISERCRNVYRLQNSSSIMHTDHDKYLEEAEECGHLWILPGPP